jgi:recombination protein RecA
MARAQAANSIAIAEPAHTAASADFIPSGSTLLDLVLGGGWARRRCINIVGDKSTGKTLLAIEATANFDRFVAPASNIRYGEAEAAFDVEYAQTMGMPVGVQFSEDMETVEQWHDDLLEYMKKQKGPGMYVLDSLDSLSDTAEMEQTDVDKGSYGTAKAKAVSKFFRQRIQEMERTDITLIVISQIRDKIGVMFGEKHTRSGGKALDFYSSQIIWLHEIGKLKRTYSGIERVYGLTILAKNKKNKVGAAWREAEIDLIFNYGIDDETSMIKWLKKAKANTGAVTPEQYTIWIADCRKRQDRNGVAQIAADLRKITVERWLEIEDAMAPHMTKYGD